MPETTLFNVENKRKKPLASRMRPNSLSEFIGQGHFIGKGKFLRRLIERDELTSLLFYGPPGTGKTTLAYIIYKSTNSNFNRLNAVTSGISDIRKILEKAEKNLELYNKRTLIFIDEVHRFNKNQQDALLPAVEDGTIIFIGATTENPYFSISAPLLSRSNMIEFKKLSRIDLKNILRNALSDKKRGLGEYTIEISEEAIEHLINISDGDARIFLNLVELSFLSIEPIEGKYYIKKEMVEEISEKRFILYDKNQDNHYDTISAFIKSIRGSDPDSALFWLVKMLDGGEDPKFIARRMIILASEDIGNADPWAIEMAVNAYLALERVGMPEAVLSLSQAALYLASTPKSNATYKAILSVRESLKKGENIQVPYHLRKLSSINGKNLKKERTSDPK